MHLPALFSYHVRVFSRLPPVVLQDLLCCCVSCADGASLLVRTDKAGVLAKSVLPAEDR